MILKEVRERIGEDVTTRFDLDVVRDWVEPKRLEEWPKLKIIKKAKAGAERFFTLNKRHVTAIAPDLAGSIYHPVELA
ncbi:MAG: hypothetical protein HC904_12820 [Blastochloris sp.]|nr:hypothetical protein [Blastochloris sp.]